VLEAEAKTVLQMLLLHRTIEVDGVIQAQAANAIYLELMFRTGCTP
jgi:hypothetical protein